jgi:hypothetical protein
MGCVMRPKELKVEVGQVVKFAVPQTPNEINERFVVLELRGDRVLVQFVCEMNLKPTFVYLCGDMVVA